MSFFDFVCEVVLGSMWHNVEKIIDFICDGLKYDNGLGTYGTDIQVYVKDCVLYLLTNEDVFAVWFLRSFNRCLHRFVDDANVNSFPVFVHVDIDLCGLHKNGNAAFDFPEMYNDMIFQLHRSFHVND